MASARGTLDWHPFDAASHLVGVPVREAGAPAGAEVAAIDASFSDTAAFCAAYDVAPEASANCVIVAGMRAGQTTYAAVLVLATHRADVNGVIRRELGARKAGFASMEQAIALSGMEYGGITPIGLPADWPVFIDTAVRQAGPVVIGAGVRAAKILIDGAALAELPGARVLDLTR